MRWLISFTWLIYIQLINRKFYGNLNRYILTESYLYDYKTLQLVTNNFFTIESGDSASIVIEIWSFSSFVIKIYEGLYTNCITRMSDFCDATSDEGWKKEWLFNVCTFCKSVSCEKTTAVYSFILFILSTSLAVHLHI